MTKKRTLLAIGMIVTVFVAAWILLARNCPVAGLAITANDRNLHLLKNRTSLPQPSDFDSLVTLNALLQPGDDSNRWPKDKAARIQGQVIDVEVARPEATNCFSLCRRDIHILVASHEGAQKKELVVVEVTPRLRAWAATQGIDWSEKTLQAQLIGHWCEFEGWLYLDVGHTDQAENTAPGNPTNWRATGWEIHPVTMIRVVK